MSLRSLYRKIPENIRYKYFSPIVSPLIEKYLYFKWRKKRICNGSENPDKTFYVIRYRFVGGIFGLMGYYIPQIQYALSKGFIPIIDLQNMPNMYLEDDKFGKENAWEYFFEQPCGYTLKDIEHSKNVILGNAGRISTKKQNLSRIIFDTEEMKRWHNIFSKNIRTNDIVKKYCDEQYSKLISDNDVVLGVLSRGTDYINNKPHNHPVQPLPEQIIQKSSEFMQKYGCNKVFLATEDKRIWDAFHTEFGDKLITNDHKLFEDTGKTYLPDVKLERENGKYLAGLEYLATINILSRCPYLVAGNCGGSQAAMYITEGYKDCYIFDLGLYK